MFIYIIIHEVTLPLLILTFIKQFSALCMKFPPLSVKMKTSPLQLYMALMQGHYE